MVNTLVAEQAQTIAELRQQLAASLEREKAALKDSQDRDQQLQECKRQLTESLEQQTATGEILRVIASSPTDIQPVLDVVAENAARLCDASHAVIHRLDGDLLRRVAVFGGLSRGPVGAEAAMDRAKYHTEPCSIDK